jgi:hypothetical protein
VEVWEVGKPQPDFDHLPPARLRELACQKLRYQPEFRQVAGLCRPPSAGPER